MSGENKPAANAPLSEWQVKTLENQAALIEAQRDTVQAIDALSGHVEDAAKSLGEIASLLDRLVLQGRG